MKEQFHQQIEEVCCQKSPHIPAGQSVYVSPLLHSQITEKCTELETQVKEEVDEKEKLSKKNKEVCTPMHKPPLVDCVEPSPLPHDRW